MAAASLLARRSSRRASRLLLQRNGEYYTKIRPPAADRIFRTTLFRPISLPSRSRRPFYSSYPSSASYHTAPNLFDENLIQSANCIKFSSQFHAQASPSQTLREHTSPPAKPRSKDFRTQFSFAAISSKQRKSKLKQATPLGTDPNGAFIIMNTPSGSVPYALIPSSRRLG